MKGTVPAALSRLPGFAIAQAYRMQRHAMDDALRDLGLTTPQWGTLACLGQMEGVSGADMARIHHLTPQTMHTILHNLEDDGLIVRDPHPKHGTVLLVRLTELGQERLAEATRRVEAIQEQMVSDLSDEERALLVELLGRCTQTLASSGAIKPDGFCPE